MNEQTTESGWELGIVLKEIRIRRNMSLRTTAQEAGLSRSAIIRFEAGERVPSLASLSGIAGALRIRFVVDGDGVFIEDPTA